MIVTRHRRVSDPDEGAGILYEVVDTDLVWSETKFGGATPTRWPVVPLGRTDEPGCVVWGRTVYFKKRGPGQPGGPAFVAAAREQERVAAVRQWLARDSAGGEASTGEADASNLAAFVASAEWVADCLRWRGKVLTGERAHWCHDWDGLPVDETCSEHESCGCALDFDPKTGGTR